MARTDAALPGCSPHGRTRRASNNRCHSAGLSPPASNDDPWTTPSPSTPRCRWRFRRPSPAGSRRCRRAAKLSAGIGLAALVGIGVALTMNAGQGDYKVLYANLSDKDGGAVIAQLSHDERALQGAAGRRRHPGAGGAGARPAPEAGDRRPAQGLGLRLRADGQRPLRPDPVPGAAHLPARPRRRADPLDRLARRGAERPRAPGAAEPERLLPRAAEAERLGAADAASRPHARPRAARRHRPPGVLERARARPEGGERARPDRHAAHRQRRRRATAPGSTRSSSST